MTLTTVADLASIVARAVDYEGKWPVTGGISGNRLTFSQIVEMGSRVRGKTIPITESIENILFTTFHRKFI